ncbi:MAG: non-hydrolyzing UDP-N-acetylglucosamine 2-epimerase [Bacteroidota bacterium]
MKNIATVIGARPQFIKAAPLSNTLFEKNINETLIHTGQHFDKNMSDIFFEQMKIPRPDYNLHIHGLGHGAMTGRMIEGIEKILMERKPELLMVYGDTNSTIAGALAAKKLHIPVAHVEAGLRSFNMNMPEEINRILTDRISDLLFCPTDTAIENLKKEGYDHINSRIYNTGDVMYDASMHFIDIARENSSILQDLSLKKDGYILSTIHRQENTDDPDRLRAIIDALNLINKEIKIILPLHPRTKQYIEKYSLNPEFLLIEPVGYLDMIMLISNSSLVITDSGGLQKEAYFFKKYCITVRDETEWIELVENRVNFLSGADKEKIVSLFQELRNKDGFHSLANLYGDGSASELISGIISEF